MKKNNIILIVIIIFIIVAVFSFFYFFSDKIFKVNFSDYRKLYDENLNNFLSESGAPANNIGQNTIANSCVDDIYKLSNVSVIEEKVIASAKNNIINRRKINTAFVFYLASLYKKTQDIQYIDRAIRFVEQYYLAEERELIDKQVTLEYLNSIKENKPAFLELLHQGDLTVICPDILPAACNQARSTYLQYDEIWCNNICSLLETYEMNNNKIIDDIKDLVADDLTDPQELYKIYTMLLRIAFRYDNEEYKLPELVCSSLPRQNAECEEVYKGIKQKLLFQYKLSDEQIRLLLAAISCNNN